MENSSDEKKNNVEKAKDSFIFVWKEALILVPILVWNDVIISMLNKLYPLDHRKTLFSKIIYAVIVTLLIAFIYFSFFKRDGDGEKKKNKL